MPSDYANGIKNLYFCRQIIDNAKLYTIPVIVDPKGRDYESYRGATAITPNRHEAIEACDLIESESNNVDIVDLISACERLCSVLNLIFLC